MRKHCLDCVIKHLGEAAVFDIEYQMGYPSYYVYVIGNLSHAAQELYESNPELAMIIREHRINWSVNPESYKIPYEALSEYIRLYSMIEDNNSVWPEIPVACIKGLALDETGKPSISGDTRLD